MSNFTNGEAHYRWNGDDVCYSTVHSRHRRRYRKRECLVCGARDRRLDWALIPGRGKPFRDGDGHVMASRDIANYVALCRSCHNLHGRGDSPCLGPTMEVTFA